MDSRSAHEDKSLCIGCHPQGIGSQLICRKTTKRMHTDGAREQYKTKLRKVLDDQGSINTQTDPHSSQANSLVKRQIEVIFAAARIALESTLEPLSLRSHWTFAALDAADKIKYLPLSRVGKIGPSPHTNMQLHGHEVERKDGPAKFLPFSQEGWIVNTS